MRILLELFYTFFLIGAFSFGGGLASMELIRSRVVSQHHWLTDSEFTDIISISEMTPGPLGINIASFTGTRIAGVPGTLASTVAYVLPAIAIVSFMAWLYYKYRTLNTVQGVLKGLRPAVAAMVFASAFKIVTNALWGGFDQISFPTTNWIAVVLCLIFLAFLRLKKLTPVKAILLSGVTGAVVYMLLGVPV